MGAGRSGCGGAAGAQERQVAASSRKARFKAARILRRGPLGAGVASLALSRVRDLPHDWIIFLREARHHWHTTGAIAPSSRWLARAMVRQLRERAAPGPLRIAEVGPGTGAFTREIARHMNGGDHLDVFDINEAFLARVAVLVARDPAFRGREVALHQLDARHLQTMGHYDVLVSGLPFNNFEPSLVDAILGAYVLSVAPAGTISFFEYLGARRARKLVSPPAKREELVALEAVLGKYLAVHEKSRDVVIRNLPPALVHHLRVG